MLSMRGAIHFFSSKSKACSSLRLSIVSFVFACNAALFGMRQNGGAKTKEQAKRAAKLERTMIKRHIIVQKFLESIQFLLIRQLARAQQEGYFLESEALLLQERSYQVIKFITTMVRSAIPGKVAMETCGRRP